MCRYHSGAASQPAGNPHRLPTDITPESYDLILSPDLAKANFTGEVMIKIKVTNPVNEIVINAADLEIQDAVVRRGNGTAFVGTVQLDEKTERAHIKVNGTLGVGEWQLLLRFSGTLNDKLKGFYRSTYKDAAGVEQVIATTQFESADARRAFPCFDEPAMKATFKVTLVIDKDLAGVSNGRLVKESINEAGKKVLEFAPTMKMSTYIVAFIVGKLVATKPVHVDGVDVRMWCVPGKESMSTFALEAAQFSLRYFRKYFGVPYPDSKLDLIAVPDFAAGAMENFGCITFRETVLVDVATASQGALDWVAKVVAHEIAHMWFGDLVTMQWWEGLWLNESFATFMETKCTNAFKRDWGVWDKFGLSRGTAFRTDALGSTRPIEFTVVSPDDAAAMFDVLTYEKGCSVMRMLEQYLGEEKFRQGIALYIKRHSYQNTVTADLWAALEEASGQPVGEIMDGWIFKSGFPVVSVEASDKQGCVVLRQQSFKYLAAKADASQLWMVPVMLRASIGGTIVESKHLLKAAEETVYIGEDIDYVVVNAGGHGFYRTLCSTQLESRLTANVRETLSVIERVNLLSDAWACVQAGLSTTVKWLDLAKLFADETDPNVWSAISGSLSSIQGLLAVGYRDKYEIMVRELVTPALERLGWDPKEGESSQNRELRGSLMVTLGMVGNDHKAFSKARELYESWKKDRTSVDGDRIGASIQLLAEKGDATLYEEFYARFKEAATPEDEETFRGALSGFDDDMDLVRRTLNMCLNPKEIRTQDAPYVFANVIRTDTAGQFAWDFAKANWETLLKLYPESGLVRMMAGVIALNTPEQEKDVREWFDAHKLPGAGKQLDQILERQHISVLLRQRETPVVAMKFARPDCVGAPEPMDAVTTAEVAADADAETTTVNAGTEARGVVAPPRVTDAGTCQA